MKISHWTFLTNWQWSRAAVWVECLGV